ncbi:hypothetical protein [Pseudoxanthomonas sp. JBR18]|uniref:hypothetical protein n=1 Tax=Pseudoxanthomonas sp. JBR18 TaxID=2969308 RepID=UPI00230588BA|nr:hypothetical protein [Pseudoxanthomonas sp. JBR18]WCE04464.1 hypothetical protein PJ250_00175 [Pseudoxanthomonas sp. JBR18]
MNWTADFHGVSHLKGTKPGFQVTTTFRGNGFSECAIWKPGTGLDADVTTHDSITKAKAHGERQAELLNAVEA